jgi:sec-independent protein translocase protein TatA
LFTETLKAPFLKGIPIPFYIFAENLRKMPNTILFVSGGELVLVMLLALLFFGSKAIPDIAKTLGKGLREFKKATNEIQREINESTSDVRKDLSEISSNINKETTEINKQIEKDLNN